MSPIHASAFVYKGAGCLIMGASGTGKSRLLAEALLHGALLIGDDRISLHAQGDQLIATAALELLGVVELRGLGLIKRPDIAYAHGIDLVVMLDPTADTRLPEPKTQEYCGIAVPYVRLPPPPVLSAASLLLYLEAMQEGRSLPPDWHPLG
jgi:HPr kinase/phosphorylase